MKHVLINLFKWTKLYRGYLGAVGLVVLLATSFMASQDAFDENTPIARPVMSVHALSTPVSLPLKYDPAHVQTPADAIPTTLDRNEPVAGAPISKNSEVDLTDKQVSFLKALSQYLTAKDEWVIVTSGKRSGDDQLDIIKDRIAERNAEAKFPKLSSASVFETKTWLAAWRWLRARHVPVNAPAAVAGAKVSQHLSGHAIDFISDDLDHLRGVIASFAKSKYASEAPYRITAIVREPGCVHINLG